MAHHRIIHPQETYRFSVTYTLSDYPLLIGEILRRDRLRVLQQARRRALLHGLRKAFGLRAPLAVGSKSPLLAADSGVSPAE